ncbi:MAG: hypothetical protein IT445_16500 [Phycisphaeraceae bacterium]|nr:hypothetical protein [Phycisphaeraceae bacterium]
MSQKFTERRGLLSEQQALAILQPYLPGLMDDFRDSWDWVQDILDGDPERRSTFDGSTVAGMIFNRCVVLFGRRLDSDPKVKLKKTGRMLRALIDGKVALRFKKLTKKRNGQLCSGNVKTNAQGLIYWQMGFDGVEESRPTEITFGYTADILNTNFTGIYLACPISWYTNKWIATLDGGEQGMMLPFASPNRPDDSTEPDQALVAIESKKAKKEDKHG